ncbi:hypothetical protein [Noviherbaspirillum aridicola]|uniref:LTD domain-containing protein n=1 Tax=Noviherbaspirillum aridicola TaxID=2849687 RepID=A0ABQ4Q9H8_9BURK|nr:hypothetical protein [Noviherbaspirillum aridicola]GIZ53724.1 hypothetical protein NCCP691_37380 [Noviherbaspirillum aridicola]
MPRARHLKRLCIAAALTLAGIQPTAAQLRIAGLLPFEQGASGEATPVVDGGTLQIPLADRSLRISPWPAFLPQEFKPQQVEARRQPAPAGPSDRISMRHAGSRASWLEIAAGARASTAVVGGWTLRHTSRGWWLAQGTRLHFLGQDAAHARAVMVPAGMERWCVHLLDSSVPAERPGAATEGEAQAAWVAVRTSPRQRCGFPAQGAQPSWRKVDGVAGPAA